MNMETMWRDPITCTCSKEWKESAEFCVMKRHEMACTFFNPLGTRANVLPENQGKRTIIRPRHDLIPIEWLDALADVFEEGLPKYGDSWKKGGKEFLTDCLNHASNHLHLYMNGDYSEDQLAKVAWNCLVVLWHNKRQYEEKKGVGENREKVERN
jgi:hypothetical protein